MYFIKFLYSSEFVIFLYMFIIEVDTCGETKTSFKSSVITCPSMANVTQSEP